MYTDSTNCPKKEVSFSRERLLAKVSVEDEDTNLAYLKITPVFRSSQAKMVDSTLTSLVEKKPSETKEDSTNLCVKDSAQEIGTYPPRMASLEKIWQCKKGRFRNHYTYAGRPFVYRQYTVAFQPINVPAKWRPPTDTLKATGETDLTFGLGGGYKFTKYKFRNIYSCQDRKYVSHIVRKTVYMWGLFAAPIGVDLEAENTGGEFKEKRTALGTSFGIYGALEVGPVSLGAAVGFDHPFIEGARHWVYDTKPWLGLIIGLGLFSEDDE